MKPLLAFSVFALIALRAPDPSASPVHKPGSSAFTERYRILVDLDGDGVDDMLLSGSAEASGKMGRTWEVYLSRDGQFVRAGEIVAHPGAIAFEADHDRGDTDVQARRYSRIWVYQRGGGNTGAFGYYRVGEKTIDDLKSIEIYPGDGGSPLGNALYNATFKHSPAPFQLEHSSTSESGKVVWKAGEQ